MAAMRDENEGAVREARYIPTMEVLIGFMESAVVVGLVCRVAYVSILAFGPKNQT